MRDAIGGAVSLSFIAIFLIILSGYLAFTVTYNRAFRVKNKIINVLEQYEDYSNQSVQENIRQYINEIGYIAKLPDSCKEEGYKSFNEGYCIKWVPVGVDANGRKGLDRGYYKVKTSAYLDVPIIKELFPKIDLFQTTGDTKTIYGSYPTNY